MCVCVCVCVCECKDQIWVSSPKDKWTQAQKAQYNEFVENGLENWVLMNQISSKVDSDDKEMKIDWFILNKIVLGTVRGDQFLYNPYKFDYRVDSWLLQYFSCDFFDPLSMEDLLHYIIPFGRSWSFTSWSFEPLLECLSHQTPSLAFCELWQPR